MRFTRQCEEERDYSFMALQTDVVLCLRCVSIFLGKLTHSRERERDAHFPAQVSSCLRDSLIVFDNPRKVACTHTTNKCSANNSSSKVRK